MNSDRFLIQIYCALIHKSASFDRNSQPEMYIHTDEEYRQLLNLYFTEGNMIYRHDIKVIRHNFSIENYSIR